MRRTKRMLLTLVAAGLVVVIAVLGCAAPKATPTPVPAPTPTAAPAKSLKWRMPGNLPTSSFLSVITQELVDRVRKQTNGGLDITYYPQEMLMPSNDEASATIEGVVQMCLVGVSMAGKALPIANGFGVPSLGLTTEMWQQALALDSPLDKMLKEEYLKKGVVQLGVSISQGTSTYASMVPLLTVADFKGKRLRVVGEQRAAVALLGAQAVAMTGDEAVDAMRRGMIDASTTPVTTVFARGYGEFLKYYFKWPTEDSIHMWFVNKSAWETLPKEYQNILASAGVELMQKAWDTVYVEIAKAEKGLEKQGVKIVTPTNEEINKMSAIVQPLHKKWADAIGPTGKRFLELAAETRSKYK